MAPAPRRRNRNSSNSLGQPSWYELAREVSQAAAGKGYGGHEDVYATFAAERGLHIQSVRRALTALAGISKVAALDPGRAGRLRDLPATVVNTIARWAEYDRRAAFEAMDRYEAGAIGTRQVDIEEREARKRNADFFAHLTRYEGLYELDAFDTAFAHLLKDWRSEPAGPFDAMGKGPFSRCFRHRQRDERCLLLVPGPFPQPRDWENERNGIMLQAVGAASIGYRVLIVVPQASGIKSMLEVWLKTFALTGDRIEILETELRQLPKEPEDGEASTS
ncbi:hypothetical protein [Bosea sp. (in: a-proteobacteria)]|uniref:hypothetical protein n=1 Tax=Bosea sp. (in: a-proteobacteria) TaxID=1871050 RepID=UPI001226DD42|nr:hypothetical protein [Bosea sp. (in: a-proteobacteria)]TAJ27571.1 MAG: hypothetical protein EPO59_21280 [Bosea sp. (in: a-proteobacteria)]